MTPITNAQLCGAFIGRHVSFLPANGESYTIEVSEGSAADARDVIALKGIDRATSTRRRIEMTRAQAAELLEFGLADVWGYLTTPSARILLE